MPVNSVQPNDINNYNVPAKTGYQQSFKANEKNESADTFVKNKKEDSFLYKYRGVFGCLAGCLAGEAIWIGKLGNVVNSMKNMTKSKSNVIAFVFELATGLLGGLIVNRAFKKD